MRRSAQRSFLVLIGLALAALATCGAVYAQERTIEPRETTRHEHVRPGTTLSDSLLGLRTIPIANGRLDADERILRARYRIDDASPSSDSPELAARRYLRHHADDYGLAPPTSDLRLDREVSTPRAHHLIFQQTFGGIDVFDATVKVNLDVDGRVTMVLSSYRPHVRMARLDAASVSAGQAAQHLADAAGIAIQLLEEPRRVVYPASLPRIAWHLVAKPATERGEWSALIDAADGSILEWIDQSTHARSRRAADANAGASSGLFSESMTMPAERVDGSGYVFDPDPLTTAGAEYGPPYVDSNDSDIPELNAQRRSVRLPDISRGDDGLYRLQGPYVEIVGGSTEGSYRPPSPNTPDGFHFTRGHVHFEAVNAYFHTDSSQRYVQEIVPELSIHRYPVRVNPRAWSDDESTYSPSSNLISLGTGGVDDGEDAHVILHEYGHALLNATVPGLIVRARNEGMAFHEGWSDYWAVSYTRRLIESGQVDARDWRKFATWDGNLPFWEGRYLDHQGIYPDDASCVTGTWCNIYTDGLLWATSLMEIYSVLGRELTDRLNLLSHAYLMAPLTLQDAAEAIVQADIDYHGGDNLSVILDVFRRRGFVDPALFAPVVVHMPPSTTEQLGGTIRIEAEVRAESAPLSSVIVIPGADGDASDPIIMSHVGGDTYAADLPLATQPGTLSYYIEVTDEAGARIRLPAAAPEEKLVVEYGPDELPPEIRHDPVAAINVVDWPVALTAVVTDRMGVDTVWVEYVAGDHNGVFGLDPSGSSSFSGSFPDIEVAEGGVLHYRLLARDLAIGGNQSVLPADGWFEAALTSGALLRQYSFEGETDGGVTATGVWERGRPAFGPLFAWEGEAAWATHLAEAYPPHLSHSTLTLPPFRRAVHGPAYLIFWHWYDTEHLGHADPHRPDSTDILFDGGNLKFSTDGGSSWNLLRPESGYPGTVSDRFENPLGGEPAFGGFSNGWRRVVAALPEADELIIRFEFATDEGNTESGVSFAGWLLDQVSIVTELPEDEEPPRFERLPARVMTAATTAAAVPIEVTAADDIGIESIRMCYELLDHQGAVLEQDTVFFQMSSESASTYRLDFRPSTELRPAYRVRYQLAARDFNGNERWSSASGKDFWIDYVHVETVSALEGLRRTGLWARHEGRWVTARRLQTVEYSSLVMGPFDLPAGTESISLHLDHEHAFGSGVGGNLKVSDDDGETWTVIMPEGGYGAEFPSGSHFMAEEPIFNGASGGRLASTFDLSHLDGGQIRLRLDYGATRPADDGEWWSVRDLQLTVVALDDNLPIPRETRLHTNYPDPFSTTTTISYTISEQDAVLLEVYDVLGRRIDVLVWAIQAPGTYTLSYDGSRLAGGVYFLRMTSGETQEVEKMVVSR